jgi:hypothetical protein
MPTFISAVLLDEASFQYPPDSHTSRENSNLRKGPSTSQAASLEKSKLLRVGPEPGVGYKRRQW